jgi:hypothetical protein
MVNTVNGPGPEAGADGAPARALDVDKPPSNKFLALLVRLSFPMCCVGIVALLMAIALQSFPVLQTPFYGRGPMKDDCIKLSSEAPSPETSLLVSGTSGASSATSQDEWQFRQRLCVTVEKLVRPDEQKKLEDRADEAAAKLSKAEADQALAAANAAAQASAALYQQYVLFVNNTSIELSAPARLAAAPQTLDFGMMTPNEDAASKSAIFWRDILARPSSGGLVAIQIGLAPKGALFPAITKTINFRVYHPLVRWIALLGMGLIVISLCGLSYNTSLLRDGDTNDTAYSLARVQIAFWAVLSAAGFVYVWMVTGQYTHVFSSGLLVLIGLSGLAAGGSALVDTAKSAEAPKSRNLLHDISGAFQDGQPQLHRLQVIAWTLILGVIFCWNVVGELRLVDFDPNLLLLMGVANGVYLTLKTQEKQ